ncbi:hypothetical protein TWF481_004751 [Arthrobotrys musiformis]|uniref:Uncharacterized protein n=1 Tax=Arthrobotrys musiformis TaxID=47236 RepID=A0AAV9WKN2_9PEZI
MTDDSNSHRRRPDRRSSIGGSGVSTPPSSSFSSPTSVANVHLHHYRKGFSGVE